jgi:23S rRNA (guanosine2251-2'-O)-methyltransferase
MSSEPPKSRPRPKPSPGSFGKARLDKRRNGPQRLPRDTRGPRSEADDDRIELYGIHAVAAALANPERKFLKIQATDNAARRLEAELAARQLVVEPVRPRDLDNALGADTVHQGILAVVEPLPEPELGDLVRAARTTGGPLLVLDQVTDPHNVGAVLRSAAVFGASGVVTTRRHSPPLNGTLAKAASGALELVPVSMVQNLARTLEDLKQAGVTIIGLDGEGETLLDDEPLTGAVAFVLGAEGKGLRQLTRETCTRICRIATSGALASLNVSNAAAIVLHLAAMRRRQANG